MRNTTALALMFSGAFLIGVTACSSSDDDDSSDGSGAGGTASGGTTASGGGTASGGSGTGGTSGDCQSAAYFTAEEAGLDAPIVGGFDYGDNGGSCITLSNPAPGQLCVEGTAAMVQDEDYSLYWGAGLGMQFGAEGAGVDLSAYDSFTYTISGAPAGLRVGLKVAGSDDSFFVETVEEGVNTVLFSDLATGSWVDPPGVLDATNIADLQFQVPSNTTAPLDFDFCVSAVSINSGMGGMGGMGGTGN